MCGFNNSISLLLILKINYSSSNNNNFISMYEKKGEQLKSIKRIPKEGILKLSSECKGTASLSWDNNARQIRFSTGNAPIKCNLTFQYDVILTLNETSGTVLKTNQKEVGITGENYGTLSCESSSSTVATCTVTQTKLTVTGVNPGTAIITVKDTTSDKQVTYSVTVIDVTLGLSPASGTVTMNKSITSTITGSNYGTLTCSTGNATIATCSISGTTLTVLGVNPGTTTITIKENKFNKTATYTAKVEGKTWTRMYGNDSKFTDIISVSDGYVVVGDNELEPSYC